MLLKEKRVQRQQTLQALVLFQLKAVNTQQQTGTVIDAIHVVGVLHAITSKIVRIVRVEKRMRDGKTISGEGSRLATCSNPMRVDHISNPPVQGEVLEGADSQGAGEQGRPGRQNMYGVTDHNSAGALPAKDNLRRMAMKRTKKIKAMRPKVSSHLNVGINTTSNTQKAVEFVCSRGWAGWG